MSNDRLSLQCFAHCRDSVCQLVKDVVGSRMVEYLRVVEPSSMDRDGTEQGVWRGADYKLSFGFVLRHCLSRTEETDGRIRFIYQEPTAVWEEEDALRRKHVVVLEEQGEDDEEEWHMDTIPSRIAPNEDNEYARTHIIVLYVPASGFLYLLHRLPTRPLHFRYPEGDGRSPESLQPLPAPSGDHQRRRPHPGIAARCCA